VYKEKENIMKGNIFSVFFRILRRDKGFSSFKSKKKLQLKSVVVCKLFIDLN